MTTKQETQKRENSVPTTLKPFSLKEMFSEGRERMQEGRKRTKQKKKEKKHSFFWYILKGGVPFWRCRQRVQNDNKKERGGGRRKISAGEHS